MAETLTALQYLVDEHPVVSHPLLTSFGEGSFNKEQVQSWAREQYYLSLSFPDTLATLFARVNFRHVAEKRGLAEMFYREVRGGNDPDSHEAEFAKLAAFLKLDLRQLQLEEPKDYTLRFIDDRLALCQDRKISTSLAAMAVGNEYLNLQIFAAYRKGIGQIAGLKNCPTGYFEAHVRDEMDDFRIMDRAFQKVNVGCEERDLCGAVKELLAIRVRYFDDLVEDLT